MNSELPKSGLKVLSKKVTAEFAAVMSIRTRRCAGRTILASRT